MTWQETMWAELEAMDDVDQIVASGEWITIMTQTLLPALGQRRRRKILEVLNRPEWDKTRLAETIGSRSATINRLAEEGRAMIRESERAA